MNHAGGNGELLSRPVEGLLSVGDHAERALGNLEVHCLGRVCVPRDARARRAGPIRLEQPALALERGDPVDEGRPIGEMDLASASRPIVGRGGGFRENDEVQQ